MNSIKFLSVLGNLAAKVLAAEGSPGLIDFVTRDMAFEVGDYDFRATMVAAIQKNLRGGDCRPSTI